MKLSQKPELRLVQLCPGGCGVDVGDLDGHPELLDNLGWRLYANAHNEGCPYIRDRCGQLEVVATHPNGAELVKDKEGNWYLRSYEIDADKIGDLIPLVTEE